MLTKQFFKLSNIILLCFGITQLSAQSLQEAQELYNMGGQMIQVDMDASKTSYEECIAICEQIDEEGNELKNMAGKQLTFISYNTASQKYKEKKIDEAIVEYQNTIRLGEKYDDEEKVKLSKKYLPKLYYFKGNHSYKTKKYEEVILASNEALKYDENYSGAYYNMARSYVKRNKETELNEIGTKIETLENDKFIQRTKKLLASYYLKEGVDGFRSSKFDNAIANFNKSLKYNDQNALTFYYLTNAYNSTKQWNDAIISAKQAIEIEGDDKTKTAKIYFALGESYIGAEKNQEACSAFKNAAFDAYKENAEYQIKTVLKCD